MGRVWVDHSQPRTLVELGQSTGTGLYASTTVTSLSAPYLGRLLEEPVIRRRIVDVFWGPVEIQDVTVRLANLDGVFTAEYVADFRGRPMTVKRHDVTYAVTQTEWVGQIEQASLTGDGALELHGTNLNLTVFDQDIPRRVVNTTTYPLAMDVGMTIPVVFGNVPKVRLPYARNDVGGGLFEYVIEGPVTFAQLWRNGPNDALTAIQSSEYSVLNAGGITTVRFAVQQIDFQGAPHQIYADVIGFAAERHFVRAVQRLLTDPLWGLSQTVDTASFDAAASALTTATGGLLCDGALQEAIKAKDILRQLLMPRGMRLGLNALGQWQLSVDTAPGAPVMTIRDGAGPGERNLLSVGQRTRVPASDRPKIFTLGYRRDLLSEAFLFTQARTLDSVGREIAEENVFIRDHLTADKVADYLGKRLYYGQETVEDAEITPAARGLTEGQLVTFTYAPLGYTDEVMEVRTLDKALRSIHATLARYSASIHTYTPGTLPADEIAGGFTDLSRTPPAPPTAVSVLSTGTELGGDGGTSAWAVIGFTTPATNIAGTRFDIRKTGESNFQTGYALFHGLSFGGAIRLKGLVPGATYEFQLVNFNPLNIPSTGVIVSQPMPNDGIAPAVPTGYTALPERNRTLLITTGTAPSERDFKHYEFTVATGTGGSGFVTSGTMAPATLTQGWATISSEAFATNTVYYLRLRAVDYSGNVSAWGADAAFSFVTPPNPTDVTFSSYGVYSGTDGTPTGWVEIYCVTPNVPAVTIRLDYRLSGAAWVYGAAQSSAAGPSASIWMELRDLTTGMLLDVRVKAVNALNLESPGVIISGAVPSDAVPPALPTAITAVVANRAVHVEFTIGADRDVRSVDWEIWTGPNRTGSGIRGGSHGGPGALYGVTSFAITGGGFLTYGVTYHLSLRAVDFSGNASPTWTTSVAFTYTTIDTADITANAVNLYAFTVIATGSFVAAGEATWRSLVPITVAGVLPGDVISAIGLVTVVNSTAAPVLMRARFKNTTTGATSVELQARIGAAGGVADRWPFYIAIDDTAPSITGGAAGTTNNGTMEVSAEGTATHDFYFGYALARRVKR